MHKEILVSIGELVDKITILEIKKEKIKSSKKNKIIQFELESLTKKFNEINEYDTKKFHLLKEELKNTNLKLWEIEDKIRILEKNKKFDDEFIQLARSVYITNDLRFGIKSKINSIFSSTIHEIKSYEEY